MGVDGSPRTTRRRGVLVRVLAIALAVVVVLATSGCLFFEPETAGITITNESSAEVSVSVHESTSPRTYVRPGEALYMGTAGHEGNCIDWLLEARIADGTVVSTLGPPVCDKDEWLITQEDLDAALTSE